MTIKKFAKILAHDPLNIVFVMTAKTVEEIRESEIQLETEIHLIVISEFTWYTKNTKEEF